MEHFSHEHPLFLNEEFKIDAVWEEVVMKCEGCLTPISRPFYSCKQCGYVLHKVCAELPPEMNHPMHTVHPLILHSRPLHAFDYCGCDLCGGICEQFLYRCSICDFNIDIICASASHTIENKCHSHPLTPLQRFISFRCDICRTVEEGISYKCSICPFWVHQKCTILPSTIRHSDHHHLLILLPSIPPEYGKVIKLCDICHSQMTMLESVYYCDGCLFFAHANCAASESRSVRGKNIENQDEVFDQCPVLLPVRKESTYLITRFVENYNLQDNQIRNEIYYFSHHHPLFLLDGEQIKEKICQACTHPISAPSYGCLNCNYFLHKCCTELPRQIFHTFHPEHKLVLFAKFPNALQIYECECCWKKCNGFGYKCLECEDYIVDIKCGSLLGPIRHEAHKHALFPRILSSFTCNVCTRRNRKNALQCEKCNFILCPVCAMLPPVLYHRYDKHPFTLTYSPIENHDNEYLCELCEGDLNPKVWFYHCGLCDQSIHMRCMSKLTDDSCIRYGELCKVMNHPHDFVLVSFTKNYSDCSVCRTRLNKKFAVGLECKRCDLRYHLECVYL